MMRGVGMKRSINQKRGERRGRNVKKREEEDVSTECVEKREEIGV